ncbi:MAG: CHASE2 domain-containing protein [Verrucomicrobiota bacterium]
MKNAGAIRKILTRPALPGAALTLLAGLVLLLTPLGEAWVNTSYDYLFRFGSRSVTNNVMLVLMDDESCERLHQERGPKWDRGLHTRLLHKLAADNAALVIFDIHFKSPQTAGTDQSLAEAMRQQGRVVLMAGTRSSEQPDLAHVAVWPPQELFLKAAAGCGIGQAGAPTGQIVRQHWPFLGPAEGSFRSLGWAAAEQFRKQPDPTVEQQWLRYYGENGAWEPISYVFALSNAPGFFRDKIVFIGNSPHRKSDPGLPEEDKFFTPYSRWNGKAVGGMEIMATTFLNLVNDDWLRRPSAWIEVTLLALTGILLGGGLCRLKPLTAGLVAAGISLTVMLAFVSWSYISNYWFPWLIIAGGQVPCALGWAWVSQKRPVAFFFERFPGYMTVGAPIGRGAFGKVWLVRDALGHLQALKEIERSEFNRDEAYESEFSGIKHYMPVSLERPFLLHIHNVNRNHQQGYFYYVMELGEALNPDWEQTGEAYRPRDLAAECRRRGSGRLPPQESIQIGIDLLEPLVFLHRLELVHRDLKPANIVFVKDRFGKDRPKIADVGTVREASQSATVLIFTPGYMPPEGPGKPADIYAMGKVLYVISTANSPEMFPAIPPELAGNPEFMRLNEIIVKACQITVGQRYPSAVEMLAALRDASQDLEDTHTRRS